jgi:hypothetical protein
LLEGSGSSQNPVWPLIAHSSDEETHSVGDEPEEEQDVGAEEEQRPAKRAKKVRLNTSPLLHYRLLTGSPDYTHVAVTWRKSTHLACSNHPRFDHVEPHEPTAAQASWEEAGCAGTGS